MPKRNPFYFVELTSPHIGHFDEGWCYSEKYIRQTMEDEEIEEITVYLARREKNPQGFYCREDGEVYLKEDMQCGIGCMAYAPRNGKSGICKHHRGTWEATDEKVSFRRNDPKQRRLIHQSRRDLRPSDVEFATPQPSKGLEPLEGSANEPLNKPNHD